MTTTFIRLLSAQDKDEALSHAVASIRAGMPEKETVFVVDPASFSKVPNSPFTYWVDDSIRDLFVKLPPFKSEGRTVRVGLQPSDDFRFVRARWEVPAGRRLDAANGSDWQEVENVNSAAKALKRRRDFLLYTLKRVVEVQKERQEKPDSATT